MTDDWQPAGRLTFGGLLDQQAEAFGDKPFLWIDDRCITFADARRRAIGAANSLLALVSSRATLAACRDQPGVVRRIFGAAQIARRSLEPRIF